MGRNWLGVSNHKYHRMPHANSPPESLWWYTCQAAQAWADDIPTDDSLLVIGAYVQQCAKGRKLPDSFRATLLRWLQDLSREHKISPRRKRYWTIPAYALAHHLHPKTLCKRFRELEKIAIRLFPHRSPRHRRPVRLSEETKQAIRTRFLEVQDFAAVAAEFGIEPFRVGQLCRAQKAAIVAEREQPLNSQTPARDNLEDPELPF